MNLVRGRDAHARALQARNEGLLMSPAPSTHDAARTADATTPVGTAPTPPALPESPIL